MAEQQEQAPAPKLELWEGSSAYVNQGKHWSSAIIWLSSSLFGIALIWAFTAKVDQTISVRGRLEPSGSVREVDAPSSGVVSDVLVKEGEMVKAGQPLFTVEAEGLASRRKALITTRELLQVQAKSLKAVLVSNGDPSRFGPEPTLPVVTDPQLRAQLITARQQSQQLRSQLEQLSVRLASRRETLRLQQRIATDLKPLYEGGGMARNQYLNQLNQVQETKAEVASLQEERTRVIGQAATQLNEVDRQLLGLNAELVQLRETISYRTIKAPIDGKVFDTKVSRYSVVNADQTVLKLVPANRLQARVEISNADIGFVKAGMPTTVSVDSFPSGEFGYIQGTLTSLGSDALPPSQETPQYRFPAIVSLRQQTVESGNKQLNLQSGMSVTANIKLRSRPVISIVCDQFTKQLDGVKRFR